MLLDRIREDADARGLYTLWIEAPENRSLPSVLAPQLRLALLKLSNREKAKHLAERALRGLAGFVNGLKVKYQDLEVGLDFSPEAGLADNGDLESDLQDLMEAVGAAAQADDSCVVLFVDELQYVHEDELAALITALHRTNQRQLPVTMFGAGLPQLRGRMGKAKSYAERLFDFPEIGALLPEDAKLAISKPAEDEGVEIEPAALDMMVHRTQCYPYFLQEWGKCLWDVADESPITACNVDAASKQAVRRLGRELLSRTVRPPHPHREEISAGNVGTWRRPASLRGISLKPWAGPSIPSPPTRSQLINKGMVWSPSHGDTAFTVPMFDQFMLRIMPEGSWE